MIADIVNQICLGFYPVAAVSTQSGLDIATVILFLATTFLIYKKRAEFVFRSIGIEWAFLGYVIVVILSFMINASKEAEWFRSAIKFSWIINLYILIYVFQSKSVEVKNMIKVLSLGSLLPTVYSLVSYHNGVDLLTGRLNERITGLVNSSTYHAHGNAMLFVALVAGLSLCGNQLSRLWKWIAGFSTFLLGLSILLTFTRGIWLSVCLSSFLMVGYLFGMKRFFQFFTAVLVASLLAVQIWPRFSQRIQDTNLSYNHERIDLTRVNFEIWSEYPWLGIGYGENLRRVREYWDRPHWNQKPGYIESHAHNQYLNVLSTTGVLGEVFFLCFFFFFVLKNWKLLRQTSREQQPKRFAWLAICFWAQLQFVFACLTDVSFEYAKIRALIIIVWALVIAIDQKPAIVKESLHA